MKLLFIMITILLISCNKNEKPKITTSENEVKLIKIIDSTGSEKIDTTVIFSRNLDENFAYLKDETKKYEYVYKAFDGTEASVTFTHYPDSSFILIERNKFNIELPLTKANNNSATFEKNDIKAEIEGKKLTLTQNKNTFELILKK